MAVQNAALEQSKKSDLTAAKAGAQSGGLAQTGTAASGNAQKSAGTMPNLEPLEKGSTNKARVLDMQRRLQALGYNTNGVDAGYGKGTIAAVTAFQQANNLPATGKADIATLERIYQQCPNPEVGSLSAKYESYGKDAKIGYDKNGGTSYGRHQFASKKGVMDNFVAYLQQNGYADLAQTLSSAKPYDTGSKTGKCPTAWINNASKLALPSEKYTQKVYLTDSISKKSNNAGNTSYVEFINSSPTLQEVYLSTSVNHGMNSSIMYTAYKAGISKADYIKAIYALRKKRVKGNKYEESLVNRYTQECEIALGLLALEESSGGTSKTIQGALTKSAPAAAQDKAQTAPKQNTNKTSASTAAAKAAPKSGFSGKFLAMIKQAYGQLKSYYDKIGSSKTSKPSKSNPGSSSSPSTADSKKTASPAAGTSVPQTRAEAEPSKGHSVTLTAEEIASARTWTDKKYYKDSFISVIQKTVGQPETGSLSDEDFSAIASWQQANGLSDVDGKFGSDSITKAGVTPEYTLTEHTIGSNSPKFCNERQFTNSKSLDTLEGSFKSDWMTIFNDLSLDASKISSTRRHPCRAAVMYLAKYGTNGGSSSEAIKRLKDEGGVIVTVGKTGSPAACSAFGLGSAVALNSDHTRGVAIDLDKSINTPASGTTVTLGGETVTVPQKSGNRARLSAILKATKKFGYIRWLGATKAGEEMHFDNR